MNQIVKEWNSEPNEEEWLEPITKYRCKILRHQTSKHLCGYVYVPKSHPWFKKEYSDPLSEDPDSEGWGYSPESMLSVHGGITFSGKHRGEKKVWCFGFDCAHLDDLVPGMIHYGLSKGKYRNWEYVKKECEQLAEQLATYEPKRLTTEVEA